jgi:Mg/Co/Ni transporter MgtE
VVEEGVYIGSIAAEDIETFEDSKKVADYKYSLESFLHEKYYLARSFRSFAKNHSNLIPVLDENNVYVGYYEINDIMNFFHQTTFLREQGNIIKVKKNTHDYSMSQIAQIVEVIMVNFRTIHV